MLQLERTDRLLAYLEEHHSATVKQIAKDIGMSETTVRRDLSYLEKQQIVRRSYGFAVLLKYQKSTLPFHLRRQDNRKEKTEISRKALSLIKRNETLFLDESSTTCILAEMLDPSLDLTVVTTSLIIASTLAEKHIRTYCTGGLVQATTLSFSDRHSEMLLSSVYADRCFFSSSGVQSNGLICDKLEEKVAIIRQMLQHSTQKIYLCDHTKLDTTHPYIVASAAEIDYLICDTTPPENYRTLFASVL